MPLSRVFRPNGPRRDILSRCDFPVMLLPGCAMCLGLLTHDSGWNPWPVASALLFLLGVLGSVLVWVWLRFLSARPDDPVGRGYFASASGAVASLGLAALGVGVAGVAGSYGVTWLVWLAVLLPVPLMLFVLVDLFVWSLRYWRHLQPFVRAD